jgi:hypothetical protein
MAEILEIIKEIPGCKIDDLTDRPYFEKMPEGFRRATFDDFHVKGKKKIDMLYLIHGFHSDFFFPYLVNEELTGVTIKPWMDVGRVYVQSASTHQS